MEDERTILDTQSGNNQNVNNSQKKTGIGEKAAYAAGGAVFGAGATLAGQAAAARKEEDPIVVEDPKEGEEVVAETEEAPVETVDPANSPAPEDSIVATATGVRVAQVDDEVSFSQAFADARRQVGPGGVFEWRGRVYGTYYKDEWENMSSEERAEYQASIDYKDVVNHEDNAQHHSDMAHNDSHQNNNEGTYAESAQHYHEASTETAANDAAEIQVLEVGETDLNGDGVPENIAVLDVDGQHVILVDIDQDGEADVLLSDDNGNGYLDEGEMYDLTGENIAMPNMTSGDMYLAQNDGPDYMNDADVNQYV